jgi:hypothetical protein
MGVLLIDNKDENIYFDINFWHWRAIVEEIKRLKVIPENLVDGLHEQYCGNGLNIEQCCKVADALQKRIYNLKNTERILFNGEITEEPDTYEFYRDEVEKNYSTNKEVMEKFIEFLKKCNGFELF